MAIERKINPDLNLLFTFFSSSKINPDIILFHSNEIDEDKYLKIQSICKADNLEDHIDNFCAISGIIHHSYVLDEIYESRLPQFVTMENEKIKIRKFLQEIYSFEEPNKVTEIVFKTQNKKKILKLNSEYHIDEILTFLQGLRSKYKATPKRKYDFSIISKNVSITAYLIHFYLQNYTSLKAKEGKETSTRQRQFIGKFLIISKIPPLHEKYEYDTYSAKDTTTHPLEAYVHTLIQEAKKSINKNKNTPP